MLGKGFLPPKRQLIHVQSPMCETLSCPPCSAHGGNGVAGLVTETFQFPKMRQVAIQVGAKPRWRLQYRNTRKGTSLRLPRWSSHGISGWHPDIFATWATPMHCPVGTHWLCASRAWWSRHPGGFASLACRRVCHRFPAFLTRALISSTCHCRTAMCRRDVSALASNAACAFVPRDHTPWSSEYI